jgi:hypothetical protein
MSIRNGRISVVSPIRGSFPHSLYEQLALRIDITRFGARA